MWRDFIHGAIWHFSYCTLSPQLGMIDASRLDEKISIALRPDRCLHPHESLHWFCSFHGLQCLKNLSRVLRHMSSWVVLWGGTPGGKNRGSTHQFYCSAMHVCLCVTFRWALHQEGPQLIKFHVTACAFFHSFCLLYFNFDSPQRDFFFKRLEINYLFKQFETKCKLKNLD